MIGWGAALLALLMGVGAEPDRETREGSETQYAQLVIRQQIIVRVPDGPRQSAPAGATPIEWRESRGPRCVPASSIAGATLVGPSSVDLILRDNSRMRALLENRCPALDYYYGFYVNATEDGQICADRDAIRSRMGGECRIDRFRTLRPAPTP
jgi:hypothetical protein